MAVFRLDLCEVQGSCFDSVGAAGAIEDRLLLWMGMIADGWCMPHGIVRSDSCENCLRRLVNPYPIPENDFMMQNAVSFSVLAMTNMWIRLLDSFSPLQQYGGLSVLT